MPSKGTRPMSHTSTNCLECNTLIPVGKRRLNQTLCLLTDEERQGNPKKLSPCQVAYYSKKKQKKKKKLHFIICDICHKKINPEDPLQVRCKSAVEGVDSPCQAKAKKNASKRFREKKKDSNKDCLKCGKKFESDGKFNRICDPCDLANARVARKMHKLASV